MNTQKLHPGVAAAIAVAAIVILIFGGNYFYQKSTGGDVANKMHEAMDHAKPGAAPFTAEQMESFKHNK